MINLNDGVIYKNCGDELCFPVIRPIKTDEYTSFDMAVKLPPSVFVNASNPIDIKISYSPAGLLSGPSTLSMTSANGSFSVSPISQSPGFYSDNRQAFIVVCIPGHGYKKVPVDICDGDDKPSPNTGTTTQNVDIEIGGLVPCHGSLVDDVAGTCREVVKIFSLDDDGNLVGPNYYETATDIETIPIGNEQFSSEPCDSSSVICLTCS